ncbi:MAG TPA: sugar phosphate isomerase/epimerase [Gemmataceae bacterium]|nr:sugar phosphate isomerase/epimerase [Gemmataceae bacterium]
MGRDVTLFSGTWSDIGLDDLALKVKEWGYQGLELCCWGEHFEVQRSLAEADYCQQILDLLAGHELNVSVLSNHRVGQAICDPIDQRHRRLVPDYVWGDGHAEGVQQRASEEMAATIRAAQRLGVSVVSGFSGSPIWSYVAGYPGPTPQEVAKGLRDFAAKLNPLLDTCAECEVKFACEVHPGQVAFDLYSAEQALDALDGREEFGFTFDPSHFLWQGIDPVEFLRKFPERIFHVHIKDACLTLNGRSGLLNSYFPAGDSRRGWDFRAPGRGGIDWEAIIRGLNEIGYQGPLSVEFKDVAMDRDSGAEEAYQFVKRLDFEPAHKPKEDEAFRPA